MSETKHTPGPWSLPHFAEPDVNCECKWVLCDHMMGAVAAVYCSGEGDDWQKHGDNPKFAEAVANAHLIAAAPEMLTALKLALQDYTLNDSVARVVEDAIAKAEGCSPVPNDTAPHERGET